MFDIGFSELIVIGIVALVVIGPERLPRVARTLGVLFGRMQRYVSQVKSDINREMDLSELNRVKNEFEGAARSFQSDVQTAMNKTESELREAQASIEKQLNDSATDSVMPSAPLTEPPVAPSTSQGLLEDPAPSPQLELGIEEPVEPRERKAG
ncbi:twin arginine-targeting protein translocase TatB [Betaproteobacteria bacterium GR16-43]|nr:twin arginine-targeting protein translocase TatB [Betaproteobacteria bacterium GR16-43]